MSECKKTLVILSPAFATNEQDEVLIAQENLILAINENYPLLEVIIIAFHFPLVKHSDYKWHNNMVVPLNGGMKGKLNSLLLWMKAWQALRKINATKDIMGLFSFFCSESAFVGHYFSHIYKLKHFIWVLGQDAKKENKQVRRIKPASEELIVISDFLQQQFTLDHKIKPRHIIPIGINPDLFPSKNVERTIDILGAGSLIKLKNYDLFIEVVSLIAKRKANITATLLGNGPEETRLKYAAIKSGLEHTLSFEGRKKNTEVIAEMQKCRVFLHTSSYEGFGAVCLEALYAGAHVISFCRPMKEDIPHWYIVSTKEDMAEKAFEILNDKTTEYTPVMVHNINDCAKRIIELYDYKE